MATADSIKSRIDLFDILSLFFPAESHKHLARLKRTRSQLQSEYDQLMGAGHKKALSKDEIKAVDQKIDRIFEEVS